MSDNKIIDGVSDVKTEIHHEGDDIIVNRVQAIGGILDANTIDYNNYTAPTKDTAMKRVASIPMVIVEQWIKEGINVMNPSEKDKKRMWQKLNSNEFLKLRTAPGNY
jgi:hypothetical protein|tara:strand:+ start:7033 stop:7353 length:321 start_codon:yes stop_codon:yes gene_type:complete